MPVFILKKYIFFFLFFIFLQNFYSFIKKHTKSHIICYIFYNFCKKSKHLLRAYFFFFFFFFLCKTFWLMYLFFTFFAASKHFVFNSFGIVFCFYRRCIFYTCVWCCHKPFGRVIDIFGVTVGNSNTNDFAIFF